ncbi:MAG: transcription elongation factor GreA [Dehalococcoidia bacterium]|nr:transcription elongation factor GreA [Dehalococcoidia bacterium]MDZ4277762.1 transcription elongation factor GreA [Dehalococcoidia bacterium]
MPNNPVLLTEEGLSKLGQELDHLKTALRPQVAERIRQSKELASTQNNAEYDDAKNEQAFIEGRILTLEKLIQDATIIDEEQAHHASQVQIGSTVTVSAGKGMKPQEFHIVGSAEADPKEGRISNESPVGQALLGKRVGDQVQVSAPKGVLRYTVTKIS